METLEIKTDTDGIAMLLLNRVDKHNAMSGKMISELTAAASTLGKDASVRAVILSGNGKSFCAGGDLDWMRAQMAADDATRAAEAGKLAGMLSALNTMPKPLIGAVQGNAFGGGLGLMSVCDTVICANHARFALTETRLGLIPATIGPYVVSRMGEANARRVFMSGRMFDAQEAISLGLVAWAVPSDNLNAAAFEEARTYLACAPGAVADAKALLRELGPVIDAATIEASIAALVNRWKSSEAEEGIAAFFERRKPGWAKTQ